MTLGEAKAVVGNLHTDYYTKQAKIEGIKLIAHSNCEKITRAYLLESIKFLLECLEEQNDD